MQTTQRLESLEVIGIKLGLENIKKLLEKLGNPQNSFASVLIAGTNGKGSVSAMLSEILIQHGFRTGHYVSPHLTDVRERMRVDGEWIPSTEFESELSGVFEAVDRLMKTGELAHHPTYFEVLTATAFRWFSHKNIDWAVVEVGMGGRFDATNVLAPRLSVITTIDFDHEAHLGRTLFEIAREKAGIIKPGGHVVCGSLPPEARSAVDQAVKEQNAEIHEAAPGAVRNLILADGCPVFNYAPWDETIRVGLRGRHQAENAVTALAACDQLSALGLPLEHDTARAGLAKVKWPGRLDLLPGAPPVLLDCAHNPGGVRTLSAFLGDMNWARVVALFTAMSDKQFGPMLALLSDRIETLFLTRVPPLNRCATADQLTQAAKDAGLRSETADDDLQAFERARQEAAQKGLPLVVFGSMYLIGKILKEITTKAQSLQR